MKNDRISFYEAFSFFFLHYHPVIHKKQVCETGKRTGFTEREYAIDMRVEYKAIEGGNRGRERPSCMTAVSSDIQVEAWSR